MPFRPGVCPGIFVLQRQFAAPGRRIAAVEALRINYHLANAFKTDAWLQYHLASQNLAAWFVEFDRRGFYLEDSGLLDAPRSAGGAAGLR